VHPEVVSRTARIKDRIPASLAFIVQ